MIREYVILKHKYPYQSEAPYYGGTGWTSDKEDAKQFENQEAAIAYILKDIENDSGYKLYPGQHLEFIHCIEITS